MKRTYWSIIMFSLALINFGFAINTVSIFSFFVVFACCVSAIFNLYIDKKLKEDWDKYLEQLLEKEK